MIIPVPSSSRRHGSPNSINVAQCSDRRPVFSNRRPTGTLVACATGLGDCSACGPLATSETTCTSTGTVLLVVQQSYIPRTDSPLENRWTNNSSPQSRLSTRIRVAPSSYLDQLPVTLIKRLNPIRHLSTYPPPTIPSPRIQIQRAFAASLLPSLRKKVSPSHVNPGTEHRFDSSLLWLVLRKNA